MANTGDNKLSGVKQIANMVLNNKPISAPRMTIAKTPLSPVTLPPQTSSFSKINTPEGSNDDYVKDYSSSSEYDKILDRIGVSTKWRNIGKQTARDIYRDTRDLVDVSPESENIQSNFDLIQDQFMILSNFAIRTDIRIADLETSVKSGLTAIINEQTKARTRVVTQLNTQLEQFDDTIDAMQKRLDDQERNLDELFAREHSGRSNLKKNQRDEGATDGAAKAAVKSSASDRDPHHKGPDIDSLELLLGEGAEAYLGYRGLKSAARKLFGRRAATVAGEEAAKDIAKKGGIRAAISGATKRVTKSAFMRLVVIVEKRLGAEIATKLAAAEGLSFLGPVGLAIMLGLSLYDAYSIYKEWSESSETSSTPTVTSKGTKDTTQVNVSIVATNNLVLKAKTIRFEADKIEYAVGGKNAAIHGAGQVYGPQAGEQSIGPQSALGIIGSKIGSYFGIGGGQVATPTTPSLMTLGQNMGKMEGMGMSPSSYFGFAPARGGRGRSYGGGGGADSTPVEPPHVDPKRSMLTSLLGGGSKLDLKNAPDFSEGGKQRYNTRIPASIRHNNPGATWDAPWMKAYGMNGVDIIGGHNHIANFPNAIQGAAANFDLMHRSKNYAGQPLSQFIATWSGHNSSSQYTARIAKAMGISPNTIITKEMIEDPNFMPKFLFTQSQQESGKAGGIGLTLDQFKQAHALFRQIGLGEKIQDHYEGPTTAKLVNLAKRNEDLIAKAKTAILKAHSGLSAGTDNAIAGVSNGPFTKAPTIGRGQDRADVFKQGSERLFYKQGNLKGVDPRLLTLLRSSTKDLPPGFHAEIISGHDGRSTGTRNHPNGLAVDLQIFDNNGKMVRYNGNSPGWKYYESLYRSVHIRGQQMYPHQEFIWGGAWISHAAGRGDPMHYQIREPVPGSSQSSGKYSFENGLSPSSPFYAEGGSLSPEERKSYDASVRARMSEEVKVANSPSTSSTNKKTILFAHGMMDRYGKTSPEEVEAAARKIAAAQGATLEVLTDANGKPISGSGHSVGSPLYNAMVDRMKKGGVYGVIGFSAGANAIAALPDDLKSQLQYVNAIGGNVPVHQANFAKGATVEQTQTIAGIHHMDLVQTVAKQEGVAIVPRGQNQRPDSSAPLFGLGKNLTGVDFKAPFEPPVTTNRAKNGAIIDRMSHEQLKHRVAMASDHPHIDPNEQKNTNGAILSRATPHSEIRQRVKLARDAMHNRQGDTNGAILDRHKATGPSVKPADLNAQKNTNGAILDRHKPAPKTAATTAHKDYTSQFAPSKSFDNRGDSAPPTPESDGEGDFGNCLL